MNKMELNKCLLCSCTVEKFYSEKSKQYYKCNNCSSVMLDPKDYISKAAEGARYNTHNNDVFDPRYQRFVSPIVNSVIDRYDNTAIGLDFGAGPGPVITKMLNDKGYTLNLYDPFFHKLPENLQLKYDYIVCSEVMEHFHHPYDEFMKLDMMLNDNGSIFCLTDMYHDEIDFSKWYYKNDETHVFFYHMDALIWIKDKFGFNTLEVDKRLIRFIK